MCNGLVSAVVLLDDLDRFGLIFWIGYIWVDILLDDVGWFV